MSFELGDMKAVIGVEAAARQAMITQSLQMSINRLDAAAQKSLFEVDANETGLSNAERPRAAGGAASGN